MNRLRLAPSSPERMAKVQRELAHWVRDRRIFSDNLWRKGRRILIADEIERATRLLLRWYADSHGAVTWAAEKSNFSGRSIEYYYRLAWETHYPHQFWPRNGDERHITRRRVPARTIFCE
jgi:hypothetical protein